MAILIAVLSCSTCSADEIIFKNKGSGQKGTIVEESDKTVTITFPKEAIKSINRSNERPISSPGKVLIEDNGGYITVKIPRQRLENASSEIQVGTQLPLGATDAQLQEKMERLERRLESVEKGGSTQSAAVQGTAKIGSTHEALLQEEMGSIEGTILWHGAPLKDAKVKIVMEQYTGFSVASLKKVFGSGNPNSYGEGFSLDTITDSQGHYSFSKVPPGSYTLFWQPDPQTGWVRRIRENPDFEIFPGKPAVLNIPEKKNI